MPSGGSVMNWPPSLIRHGVHFLQLLRVIVLDRLPLELERRSHEPRFGRPEFLRENKENISCLYLSINPGLYYQFALIHLVLKTTPKAFEEGCFICSLTWVGMSRI